MGTKSVALILTAAGRSSRFGSDIKKEYAALRSPLFPECADGTVLSCAAETFLYAFDDNNTDFILSRFVVTVPASEHGAVCAQNALGASPFVSRMLEKYALSAEWVEGGIDRQASVRRALEHLKAGGDEPDIVLIHDGARPFVKPQTIMRVLRLCAEKGAAAPCTAVVDTYKETDGNAERIVRHVNRSRLRAVQTPQGFYFKPLSEAHRKAHADGTQSTDDTEIWGMYAGDVYLCEGERSNVKITYRDDLPPGEGAAHSFDRSDLPPQNSAAVTEHRIFRSGLGSDMHRLETGRPLLIGGVHIPFEKGETAHSDGDVLLHAITDALLGAAALGDIGELFPPSDNRWKNADSAVLLQSAWTLVQNAGFELENLDCVIRIERPKLLTWREKIRGRIADILSCSAERIFVKAKTAEGLGDIGEGRAVAAECICLLSRPQKVYTHAR